MTAQKLLIVSFTFPPQHTPRSLQLLKTVNALARLGWDITVYTADRNSIRDRLDWSLAERLDPSIRVIGGRNWENWFLANAVASLHVGMPDDKFVWRFAGRKALKNLLKESSFDVMASFGHQMSSHLLALDVRKFSGLPWLAHFSDPWVDDPIVRRPWPFSAVNRMQERAVCQTADSLCFTTYATQRLATEKYGPKVAAKGFFVPHCFDRNLYPKVEICDSGHLDIVHFGTFFNKRKPTLLLEAVRRLVNRRKELRNRLRIHLLYQPKLNLLYDFEKPELKDVIVFRPKMDYIDSLASMQQATVLMSLDSDKYCMLSKLGDYIGTGRPILAISDPESPTAKHVAKLHGLVARNDSTEDIERKLEELCCEWEKDPSLKKFSYTAEEAQAYDYLSTTKTLSDRLLELCDRKTAKQPNTGQESRKQCP